MKFSEVTLQLSRLGPGRKQVFIKFRNRQFPFGEIRKLPGYGTTPKVPVFTLVLCEGEYRGAYFKQATVVILAKLAARKQLMAAKAIQKGMASLA